MTLVSSRIMPAGGAALWDIKTFGSAGRDYTSVATWEAATRGDLTGAETKSPVLECYADAASFSISAPVVFGNAVASTSATKFRVIKTATQHENRFKKDDGVVFKHAMTGTSDYYVFNTSDEAYLSFFDLGFTAHITHNSTKDRGIFFCNKLTAGAGNTKIVGCYFFDMLNIGSGQFYSAFSIKPLSYANCVANNVKLGFYGSGGVNLTAINCGVGIQITNVYNSISQGNTTAFVGGTQHNCVSSGVIFAADGISLDASDTTAREQGTDLEATNNFNDDGMGNERGDGIYTGAAWDIGAIEYYKDLDKPKPGISFTKPLTFSPIGYQLQPQRSIPNV